MTACLICQADKATHTQKKKQSFCLAVLVSNTAIRKNKRTNKKTQTPSELGIDLAICSVGNEVMGRSGLKSRMKLKSLALQNIKHLSKIWGGGGGGLIVNHSSDSKFIDLYLY